MAHAATMFEQYPAEITVDRQLLARCIDASCAQACTACADACLSEPDVAQMTRCVRDNLDCAQACRTCADQCGDAAGSPQQAAPQS